VNLVLLPGNSLSNKEWIEKISDILDCFFVKKKILYYKHWGSRENIIDIDYELNKLQKIDKNFDDYVIFAKSAGILLTMKGVFEKKINPQKCVFVGTPVSWARKHGFDADSWIREFHVPSLFIQHNKDPYFSSDELSKFLAKGDLSKFTIVLLKGSDHDYPEFDEIHSLVREFVVK